MAQVATGVKTKSISGKSATGCRAREAYSMHVFCQVPSGIAFDSFSWKGNARESPGSQISYLILVLYNLVTTHLAHSSRIWGMMRRPPVLA